MAEIPTFELIPCIWKVDGPTIDYDGATRWYYRGLWHREDGPAVIDSDGTQYWYWHGKLHRENGPAIIFNSENESSWFLNDKFVGTQRPKDWDDLVQLYQVEMIMES